MKAVLLSVRPEWCEKILNGTKTVEIRKTRPKLETPFKCYIYCTKAPKGWVNFGTGQQLDGKVVAEFTCDYIREYKNREPPAVWAELMKSACVDGYFLENYSSKKMVGWHISDLKVYDAPLELCRFHAPLETHRYYHPPFRRPPQSWCYVEDKV